MDPASQRLKIGDGGCDGAAAAKLADGDFSGDHTGTNMTSETPRTY